MMKSDIDNFPSPAIVKFDAFISLSMIVYGKKLVCDHIYSKKETFIFTKGVLDRMTRESLKTSDLGKYEQLIDNRRKTYNKRNKSAKRKEYQKNIDKKRENDEKRIEYKRAANKKRM